MQYVYNRWRAFVLILSKIDVYGSTFIPTYRNRKKNVFHSKFTGFCVTQDWKCVCTFIAIKELNQTQLQLTTNTLKVHSIKLKYKLIFNLLFVCLSQISEQRSFDFILFYNDKQRQQNGNSTSNKKCDYFKGIRYNYLRISK